MMETGAHGEPELGHKTPDNRPSGWLGDLVKIVATLGGCTGYFVILLPLFREPSLAAVTALVVFPALIWICCWAVCLDRRHVKITDADGKPLLDHTGQPVTRRRYSLRQRRAALVGIVAIPLVFGLGGAAWRWYGARNGMTELTRAGQREDFRLVKELAPRVLQRFWPLEADRPARAYLILAEAELHGGRLYAAEDRITRVERRFDDTTAVGQHARFLKAVFELLSSQGVDAQRGFEALLEAPTLPSDVRFDVTYYLTMMAVTSGESARADKLVAGCDSGQLLSYLKRDPSRKERLKLLKAYLKYRSGAYQPAIDDLLDVHAAVLSDRRTAMRDEYLALCWDGLGQFDNAAERMRVALQGFEGVEDVWHVFSTLIAQLEWACRDKHVKLASRLFDRYRGHLAKQHDEQREYPLRGMYRDPFTAQDGVARVFDLRIRTLRLLADERLGKKLSFDKVQGLLTEAAELAGEVSSLDRLWKLRYHLVRLQLAGVAYSMAEPQAGRESALAIAEDARNQALDIARTSGSLRDISWVMEEWARFIERQ